MAWVPQGLALAIRTGLAPVKPLARAFLFGRGNMKPVTRMLWLFVLIILGSALYFVFLDDEGTKDFGQIPAATSPAKQ